MLFSTFALHVRYALIILLLVILIILMSKWTGSKCANVTVVNSANNTAQDLLGQSQDLLVQADQQVPVIALMHTAAAHAYVDAAERLAPTKLKPLQVTSIKAKIQAKQQSLMPLVVPGTHET